MVKKPNSRTNRVIDIHPLSHSRCVRNIHTLPHTKIEMAYRHEPFDWHVTVLSKLNSQIAGILAGFALTAALLILSLIQANNNPTHQDPTDILKPTFMVFLCAFMSCAISSYLLAVVSAERNSVEASWPFLGASLSFSLSSQLLVSGLFLLSYVSGYPPAVTLASYGLILCIVICQFAYTWTAFDVIKHHINTFKRENCLCTSALCRILAFTILGSYLVVPPCILYVRLSNWVSITSSLFTYALISCLILASVAGIFPTILRPVNGRYKGQLYSAYLLILANIVSSEFLTIALPLFNYGF